MKESRFLSFASHALRFGPKIVDDAGAQGKRIERPQPRLGERAFGGPSLPDLEAAAEAPPPPLCGKSGRPTGGSEERRRRVGQEVKFLGFFS